MRTSLIAAAVVVGCTTLIVARVALAPGPVPARAATAKERPELARLVASFESNWNTQVAQNFPGDVWSQRDDFHGKEYKRVQEIAKEKRVRIEDVLRAVDADIHGELGTSAAPRLILGGTQHIDRNANAIPCKPRPFYD